MGMTIAALLWSNQATTLAQAAPLADTKVLAISHKKLRLDPDGTLRRWAAMLAEADLALVQQNGTGHDERMDEITLAAGIPAVYVSSDPLVLAKSSVKLPCAAEAYRYLLHSGQENMRRLCCYLQANVFHQDIAVDPPLEGSWEFIWHPALGRFDSLEEYSSAIADRHYSRFIGMLVSRSNVLSANTAVEKALINAYENEGVGVIPVAYYPVQDTSLGNLSGIQIIEKYFTDSGRTRVNAVVKLGSFSLGQQTGDSKTGETRTGEALLRQLNLPLLCPMMSFYKSEAQWRAAAEGLGNQVVFSIAMPEFDGAIEPIIIGANEEGTDGSEQGYLPINDRMQKLVRRTLRWLDLQQKPNRQKKIAFVLHNNPCVGAESSVGGGAHLDTLESVAKLLGKMKAAGYNVRVPENGKALIQEILEKKALSEFRFTSAEDIVKCGGALALLDTGTYRLWFDAIDHEARARIIESWGNPPGEKKNNIPPSMLYDGKIIISAVEFGNALVLVQPKRGCAGARCDGQVCLILHDPDVPPPHQYIATYQWLQNVWKADALVHVGTHGNLEFLPGKSTGMSGSCFSDIGVGDLPHLYIYNADNPAEGVIAKRRSYAVTVNHMQTAMQAAGLYGDLLELERLMDEYTRFVGDDLGKAHTIEHMIMGHSAVPKVLGDGVCMTHESFARDFKKLHGRLAGMKGSYIPKGMHVFGQTPQREELAAMVYGIVRWATAEESLRGSVAKAMQIDLLSCKEAELNRVDILAQEMCLRFILDGIPLRTTLAEHMSVEAVHSAILAPIEENIRKLIKAIQDSDETGALLNGFNGGYIAPGPSGLITRGRPDILPTGRNLYSIDPQACPSKSAWVIGQKLADGVLARFEADCGRYPNNIAFHWQSTDIMWTNGEMYAQLLYLLGCEPIWDQVGRVKRFRVMSLEEIDRPRIDITVRVSGIIRDNFPNVIELLDEAVDSVAALDEPEHLNFVRRHAIERKRKGMDWRAATARIFCSQPGTYQSGTNLAVYASAWENEKDLSNIYLFWNSFAYGREMFGVRQTDAFKESLKTVEATFNKTASDEYDLTGCCCYFGTHGGLINAAKTMRDGAEIRNYYGDTRENGRVGIRTLADEMRRVTRSKLLNPAWIEGMKAHGYKGASEMSKRIGRVYGWQATSKEVDGVILDDIARTYLMDSEMLNFFEEHNPWALEEVGRRLLEAEARGLWSPAEDVRDELKERYIEIEGWMEEHIGEGDVQGGRIDIMSARKVDSWKTRLDEVLR